MNTNVTQNWKNKTETPEEKKQILRELKAQAAKAEREEGERTGGHIASMEEGGRASYLQSACGKFAEALERERVDKGPGDLLAAVCKASECRQPGDLLQAMRKEAEDMEREEGGCNPGSPAHKVLEAVKQYEKALQEPHGSLFEPTRQE